LSLKFTNTLSKKKEDFISINPNQVKIYCCGVTVYDLCHLGHARSYLNWDVLRRFLIWKGFEVKFVQNFTDIDDKIINRANKEGCSTDELSERNIDEFHKDMDTLSILRPTSMPRATKCLHQIINFIEELEQKKVAYSSNGDVYFSVDKHKNYGKLSGREIENQIDNAAGRLKTNQKESKKNSLDFALWKKSKSGEVSYSSPWGNGRPGWHIECSAMVKQELGESIDIHLGGSDLIFPHHENEIAQSEACNGKELAKYWLHNGMVNVGGEKMSKSLGNFTTIRSLLDEGISPMTLRFFVLQTNYRKPLDFTEEALKAASKGWEKLNNCLSFGYIFKIKDKNIQNSNNEWGTGGISTKLISAEIATKGGVEVQLVDGTNKKNLIEIFDDNKIGTLFYPVEKPIGNKKSWLSHAIQTVGKITLDDGASFAIKKKGASLLAVGVKNVEGNFTINQAVKIVNTNDKEVAKGLVSISSDKLRSILNNKENNNSSIIVVHRDVLALS